MTMDKALEAIKSWYVGWANYHKMTNFPSQFNSLESHLRRRLRARIVFQKKKPRVLAKHLIKRGVNKKLVYKTVYSHKGRWALSHTKAIEQAHSNNWFEEQGLVIFSTKKLEHWLNVKEWVKLT